MPPSSRKKNKGRDRKAKKEEAKRAKVHTIWKLWANGLQCDGSVYQCNHGLAEVPDLSHPVSVFIDALFSNSDSFDDIRPALQNHPQIRKNDKDLNLVAHMLIRIAATNLIYNKDGLGGVSLAWGIALDILVLENYDESIGDVDDNYHLARHNRIVASKIRDICMNDSSCIRRDALKFFHKRMNCSCLKKMHLEARKTMPKMGKCDHCGVVKERALLMVCSRCMIDQYCSRKCQVAASPNHQIRCDDFYRAHQRTVANTTTIVDVPFLMSSGRSIQLRLHYQMIYTYMSVYNST